MAGKEITIRISKEGEIFFMYDDESMLRDFGQLQIRRASNIRWDEVDQKWRIWVVKPDGTEQRTEYVFTERKDAIQAEIDLLDKMLVSSESTVEKMFVPKK